jgi:Tol biopolymer transport system component
VWIVPLSGDQAPRNITTSNPAFDGHPKYSLDGKYIAYRMQKQPGYESDLFRLAVYDRSTGVSRVLTESFRNWVEAFHGPQIQNRSISQLQLKATILSFA